MGSALAFNTFGNQLSKASVTDMPLLWATTTEWNNGVDLVGFDAPSLTLNYTLP